MKIVISFVFFLLAVYFLGRRQIIESHAKARSRLTNQLGKRNEKNKAWYLRTINLLVGTFHKHAEKKGVKKLFEDSGLKFSFRTFIVTWIAIIIFVPSFAFVTTRNILLFFIALFASYGVPLRALKHLAQRERRKAREQCEKFAGDIAIHLKCGVPLKDSVMLSAKGTCSPLCDMVEEFASRVNLGERPESVFLELSELLEDEDLMLIAHSAIISAETGANAREVMNAIGEAIRERAAIRRELLSQTVQARMSSKIVAALPFLFLTITAGVSGEAISTLFGTLPGLIMVAVGILLDVVGLLWMRKILNVKV
ncbi:MAG: type II secretion system F family protein [Actinomycetota bacterium]|nr:type II secretion system F family protein [Actinomycetota bacterium]